MAKMSKRISSIIERAEAIARKNHHEVMTVAHVEKALLTESEIDLIFQQTFEDTYDVLLKEIDKVISHVPVIDERIVEEYERESKELPLRASKSVLKLLEYTKKLANGETEFAIAKSAEVKASHMFTALFAEPTEESVMFNWFADNMDTHMSLIEEAAKVLLLQESLESDTNEKIILRKINNNSSKDNRKHINELNGMIFPESSEEDDDEWKNFVVDLTETMKDYDKPFVGREDIIENVVRTLSRRDKSNPVLVGEPGVGKTEITKGLARKIIEGNVPEKLKNAKLYSVDLAGMIAGTKFRGDFEARLKGLLEATSKMKNVILFFDEIHNIVGAGSTSDSTMDASNILKPFLVENKIKFIGATTYNEYKSIEKDKALERRFQKVIVDEPSREQSIEILQGLKKAYGKYHGVSYSKKAIEAAVDLSTKYINDRFLPDKAIDLIDEAGAEHEVHKELGNKINEKDIMDTLSRICKIPKETVEEGEMAKIRKLDKNLKSQVFGQDEAVDELVTAIKFAKSGLGDEDKPIGSFLLVGPSGVGKTEVAKQLANYLGINFVRFDMSEYQESHSVAKLIGAPAGYVGYDEGGILTETIRKNPNCVLLFDEIEKAHPDVFKTFLQVMDYGQLTDNKGRKADFRNCIIIMTSNAGATSIQKKCVGFNKLSEDDAKVEHINEAVNKMFTPEFRNRLTKIVSFNPINDEMGKLIVKKELKNFSTKLKTKHIKADFTSECINAILKDGIDKEYGARGIQRTIDNNVKKIFVNAIINEENLENCMVDFVNGNYKLIKQQAKKKETKKSTNQNKELATV